MILPYCPHVDARERDAAWRAAARLLCNAAQRWELAQLLECPWRMPFRAGADRVAWHLRLARQYRLAGAPWFAHNALREARRMRENWHRDGGGVPETTGARPIWVAHLASRREASLFVAQIRATAGRAKRGGGVPR